VRKNAIRAFASSVFSRFISNQQGALWKAGGARHADLYLSFARKFLGKLIAASLLVKVNAEDCGSRLSG
jgi:hypothetical protein